MMKRLILGLVTIPALLASSNVLAASCGHEPVDPPDANTVHYFWNDWTLDLSNLGANSNNLTCGVTAPLEIPAGAVGYYRVDNRGFVLQPNGETTDSTTDPDFAAADTETYTDEELDFTHSSFFSSGPRAQFDADISLAIDGIEGDDGVAQLDTTDIAVFYTTEDELEGSLDDLAQGQTALVAHLGATAELLTGGNKPIDVDGSEVGLIGGYGSYMLGATGHYSIAEGFSVLGGVSLVEQGAGGASATGVLGALAIRYVDPGQTSGFRLFGEGGINLAALSTTFSRTYLSSISPTPLTIESTTGAGIGSVYLRGGALVELDDHNEVVLSATLQETGLGIAGYSEELTPQNPFPITVGDQTAWFTIVKGSAAWTTELASDVDLTANVGVGAVMAHTPVNADVAFVGSFAGAPQSSMFVDYGLRLGWMPSPDLTVDTFVQGSTATTGGTHAQIGAGLRMKL